MKETENIRSSSLKIRSVAYWITTVMIAAEMLMGGVWDILQLPYVIAIIKPLGYPSYFLFIIGLWKIAGGVVLLAPRIPRLKEWAYAGSIFNYTGAVVSHLAKGNDAGMLLAPLIFSGLTMISWWLRPRTRRYSVTAGLHGLISLRNHSIAYRFITLVIAVECIVGGIMGALQLPPFIGVITRLGYPGYFMSILGTWYMLAGITLLAPRLPRLKEWAYAGLIFNYTGALASHLAVGDGIENWIAPVVFIILTALSWAFRPPDRYSLAEPKT